MNKNYCLHWCKADPFGRFVILVVGDYREAIKECKRKFKSKLSEYYREG